MLLLFDAFRFAVYNYLRLTITAVCLFVVIVMMFFVFLFNLMCVGGKFEGLDGCLMCLLLIFYV